MAFNFSDLQQQIQQNINNQWQFISKMKEWWLDPAKDVQYQIYDPNGNLQTITVPNRAKIVNDVPTILQSQMYKTVYVDQVNGNDNNDGSQARPFKTLQRAVDSVPDSGNGRIVLVSDYTADSDVYITGKRIELASDTLRNINVVQRYLDGGGTLYRIETFLILSNSVLKLSGSFKITSVDPNGYKNYPLPSWGRGVFNVDRYTTATIMKDEINHLEFDGGGYSALFGISWGGILNLILSQDSQHHDYASNMRLFIDLNRTSVLNFWYQSFDTSYVKDANGNYITDMKSVISPIVRDSNGVPRNILSNIVL